MSKQVLVKTTSEPTVFRWAELMSGLPMQTGHLDELAEVLAGQHTSIVFLVPASDVLVKTVEFDAQERRHIVKTVPFMLEEQLITDVDRLHFVMDKPQATSVRVAAVDESVLERYVEVFNAAGLEIELALPEQIALLPADSHWVLYYEGGQYQFKAAENDIYAIDADNIELALQVATEEFANLPSRISVYISDEVDQEDVMHHLPDSVHHLLEFTVRPVTTLVTQSMSTAKVWNLMVGRFAHAEQWAAIWQQWKGIIYVVIAALCVHTGVSFANYQSLEAKNLELRKDIEKVHRSVFPKGQIVDPRKQMQDELNRLKGGAVGGGFVRQLVNIGTVLKTAQQLKINSISFDDKNADIRLDILVKDFKEVEKLKAGFSKSGLTAELLNSNAQGEQVRARLRLRG